jgi:hypothetical protein
MANIYDVEGIEEFLPEQKKPLSSFLNDYATTANKVAAPYIGMAGKYGFGNDPAKIQGLGSDVRHTTGSALGKFAIQDYLSQFGLQPSNPVSNFIANAGIAGSTVAQEISDAIRGFRQAGLEGAINQPMEDVKANFRAMGIPYGTSLEDIVNMSVKGSPSAYMANAPEEVKISRFNAPGPFNYGTAEASDLPTNSLERDFPGMSGSDIIEMMNNRGPVTTNIEDAPQIKEAIYQDRIMNPNLPGFAFQPKESLRNIIGSQLQNAKTNVGQKVGQGMDFMGGIKDYIMGGGMLGMAAKGIGGLLSNIFQESPEQKNFKENIATDPEYQNLVNSIPGMSNYNQIYAMGSGRGLMGAADRRLQTILNLENRRKRQGLELSDTLKNRRKKLEALRELERQKESAFLESQRRGSRPTAPTGGGVRDDQSDRSRGQTGGYSYSGGKREGFGYGLKDGGLASMFTRRG